VWLAQSRDPSLESEAYAVAGMFGLPLTILDTGTALLERELEQLLAAVTAPLPAGMAEGAGGAR
jgi:hypothetical protein